jgi:Flp pilus assembly pilin Flp
MLAIYVYAITLLGDLPRGLRGRARPDERGQASAEYALVLLGAAAIALLIVAWATKTDLIEKLLDQVVKTITGKAK